MIFSDTPAWLVLSGLVLLFVFFIMFACLVDVKYKSTNQSRRKSKC